MRLRCPFNPAWSLAVIERVGGVENCALRRLCASLLGFLLFSRVNEQRTLWLLRGYLFLVALSWFVKRFFTCRSSPLIEALVKLFVSLAILWQGELRRLMELLGTGRRQCCSAIPRATRAPRPVPWPSSRCGRSTVQGRRGALMVLISVATSDLRIFNPGITVDAQLSSELLFNLFASEPRPFTMAVLTGAPYVSG